MGLFDLFRMGKVLAHTARAVRSQRDLARELAALPMPTFVPQCLLNLNQSAGAWHGAARAVNERAASIASAKQLPPELAEFYSVCDGFSSSDADFPAPLLPIDALRLGGDYRPPLSERLVSYWNEHGNESEKPGLLSVLPPDDLGAMVAHAADSHVAPTVVDLALPLCLPRKDDFVVILLADSGDKLPRGSILEVEGGSATRYPGFKAWLATCASLFGSLAAARKK